MRRRKFIAGLASTTVVWSVAARAQQPERARRIGVLAPADDQETRTRLTRFRQALQGLAGPMVAMCISKPARQAMPPTRANTQWS